MPNEMEDEEQTEEFRTRNLRKTREHLKNLSVDNKHLNFDALYESQNSKIDLSKSTSTSKSVRIFSCLPSGDLRLQGTISQKIKPIPQMELVCHKKPQIRELKNEILSRTFFHKISIKTLLRISLYLVLTWLVLNSEFGGVESIPLRNTEISLRNIDRGLLTSSRTFRSHGGGGGGGGGRKGNVDHWLEKKPRRHRDQKKPVNKNCKEYDITSRAFLADLIFEGTARSRSRRASGRYVTFVIERILKQKNNLLRPKTQVRLHFGGRATRRMAKHNPLHDCPLNSITNGNRAMINLKIGEKYYVFADHFGLMNYTARGEPIVVNRRNFKSIRSVLRRKKGWDEESFQDVS
ncbi:hypothetical protein RUM43_010825 [Polyplax serrata]|uniref:Uncharacterized protein n=1 Tax=Polyplax serrata TaxID=468196 RepID=A0AAN8PTW7_POLSC